MDEVNSYFGGLAAASTGGAGPLKSGSVKSICGHVRVEAGRR